MIDTFNATTNKFKQNSNHNFSPRAKQGRLSGMLLDSLHKDA